MDYHPQTVNRNGVAYIALPTGYYLAYRLFNDTWLYATLDFVNYGRFMRKHKLHDIEDLNFTHVLKMDGHQIEAD